MHWESTASITRMFLNKKKYFDVNPLSNTIAGPNHRVSFFLSPYCTSLPVFSCCTSTLGMHSLLTSCNILKRTNRLDSIPLAYRSPNDRLSSPKPKPKIVS